MECNDVVALAADADNYLWLFCGGSGQVWKGRLTSSTSNQQKMGKSRSFPAEISQTTGVVNSFRKFSVARRMPRISIQSGVDMFPTVRIPVCSISGSQDFAFSRYRMNRRQQRPGKD